LIRALIIGATSAIAEATARLLAARGAALYLVARDAQRAQAIAADLKIRGAAQVGAEAMDANDLGAHEPMLERAISSLGGLDLALIAHGTLGDQSACEKSVELTVREINTNGVSVIALSTLLACQMIRQQSGALVVISSVAGDRGRASNYVYGSAKAMVSAFLSGLRQRARAAGVQVITVKPGFVDTPMTRSFRKGMLWAQPLTIAQGILAAIDHKRDVVYLPSFWRPIMFVIRSIPESVFKRLAL
jgi:decaprenylphospho-beta-D-erythro-pentofuranosid-2-ulose 2-reductase